MRRPARVCLGLLLAGVFWLTAASLAAAQEFYCFNLRTRDAELRSVGDPCRDGYPISREDWVRYRPGDPTPRARPGTLPLSSGDQLCFNPRGAGQTYALAPASSCWAGDYEIGREDFGWWRPGYPPPPRRGQGTPPPAAQVLTAPGQESSSRASSTAPPSVVVYCYLTRLGITTERSGAPCEPDGYEISRESHIAFAWRRASSPPPPLNPTAVAPATSRPSTAPLSAGPGPSASAPVPSSVPSSSADASSSWPAWTTTLSSTAASQLLPATVLGALLLLLLVFWWRRMPRYGRVSRYAKPPAKISTEPADTLDEQTRSGASIPLIVHARRFRDRGQVVIRWERRRDFLSVSGWAWWHVVGYKYDNYVPMASNEHTPDNPRHGIENSLMYHGEIERTIEPGTAAYFAFWMARRKGHGTTVVSPELITLTVFMPERRDSVQQFTRRQAEMQMEEAEVKHNATLAKWQKEAEELKAKEKRGEGDEDTKSRLKSIKADEEVYDHIQEAYRRRITDIRGQRERSEISAEECEALEKQAKDWRDDRLDRLMMQSRA